MVKLWKQNRRACSPYVHRTLKSVVDRESPSCDIAVLQLKSFAKSWCSGPGAGQR